MYSNGNRNAMQRLFYFDELNNYHCVNKCPENSNKIIYEKKNVLMNAKMIIYINMNIIMLAIKIVQVIVIFFLIFIVSIK